MIVLDFRCLLIVLYLGLKCYQYSVFKVQSQLIRFNELNGDGEIRTHDPLLARQVLSQLSYTPIWYCKGFLINSGLKWTRTTDLTLIRRAL